MDSLFFVCFLFYSASLPDDMFQKEIDLSTLHKQVPPIPMDINGLDFSHFPEVGSAGHTRLVRDPNFQGNHLPFVGFNCVRDIKVGCSTRDDTDWHESMLTTVRL